MDDPNFENKSKIWIPIGNLNSSSALETLLVWNVQLRSSGQVRFSKNFLSHFPVCGQKHRINSEKKGFLR